jgi:hypothetical protein
MHERLSAGQLHTREAEGLSLLYNGLEEVDRENGIGMTSCLELGGYPAVAAGEVAAFGEVKIDLIESVLSFFFFFSHAYLFTTETQRTQREINFSPIGRRRSGKTPQPFGRLFTCSHDG